VIGSTKVLRKLGKAFCKLIGFLEWLDSATCGKDGQHEFTIIDIWIEWWSITSDIPEMRGMCFPWGNAVSDAAVDGRLPIQVRTVEVNAVPAPISPRDGARFDGARGSEVIVISAATAIGVAGIDVPTAIVSRTTTAGTTDRRDTAIASRWASVTTATRRVIGKTGDIRRVVTVTAIAVIGVRSTTCTGTWEVLRSMVRGIV
jgi:hypothetical protein